MAVSVEERQHWEARYQALAKGRGDAGGMPTSSDNPVPPAPGWLEEFDGELQLGWDPLYNSRRFNGRLDDVRVIRAALTLAELETLRAASL